MTTAPKDKVAYTRLPLATHRRLRARAFKEERAISDVVRDSIDAYLATPMPKKAKT